VSGARYCYYLTPNMLTPDGYLPVIVIEGVPGCTPPSGDGASAQPSWWGNDLTTARRRVAQANALLGLTPQQVQQIAFSALAAVFGDGCN
jgi:hypothetical protein